MDDYAVTEYRDYVIKGDVSFHAAELLHWGARYIKGHKMWILFNTNETCSDYQASVELGMIMSPVQDSSKPKYSKMRIINRITR